MDWGAVYDIFANEYCYTIDAFLELNMRQLVALRRSMERRKVIDRYPLMKFFADINGAKMKSLDEILTPEISGETAFDDETDKLLEKRAQELLARGKQAHGG